ncbi:MAG TPA: hypothetical protein VIC85_22305 [Ktedonobacterales bacterium]
MAAAGVWDIGVWTVRRDRVLGAESTGGFGVAKTGVASGVAARNAALRRVRVRGAADAVVVAATGGAEADVEADGVAGADVDTVTDAAMDGAVVVL